MINKAVIVAAGLSSRLYPLTLDKPKGLLEINGESMLDRSIKYLKAYGITEIAVVIGYQDKIMREALSEKVSLIINPFYKQCNNMGSLWFAESFVGNDPFVYIHGDVLYEEDIIKNTLGENLNSKNDIELVTDFGPVDEEAMKVTVDKNNFLIKSSKLINPEDSSGEWIGLAYINNPTVVFNMIERILLEDNLEVYDTYAFTKLVESGYKVHCSSTQGLSWIEVDFNEDYLRAKRMFSK